MQTERTRFEIFGQEGELLVHESKGHPGLQIVPPRTSWNLVLHYRDLFLDEARQPEPKAGWFGPRTVAEIVYPGAEVGVIVVSLPTSLNRAVASYLGTSILAAVQQSSWHEILASPSIEPRRVQDMLEHALSPHCTTPRPSASPSKSDRTTRHRHRVDFGFSARERQQVERAIGTAMALATSSCTLADVAVGQGFHDQAHMHRSFRRHFPFTPSFLKRHVVGGPAMYLDIAEPYKT